MKRNTEKKNSLPLSKWIEANCHYADADPHIQGPVTLRSYQRRFCDKIFPAPGERQVKHALLLTSIKTGKTSLGAWISLGLLQGNYDGPFVSIGVVAPTVRQSHILKHYIQSSARNSGMECRSHGRDGLKFSDRKTVNFYSGKAQTKQGLMHSHVLIDEAAEMDSEQALYFFNMTAFQTRGFCLMLSNPASRRDNAIKGFIKQKENKNFIKHVVKTPLNLNWKKPATWIKANENLKGNKALRRLYAEQVRRIEAAGGQGKDLFCRLWLSMHNFQTGTAFFPSHLIQRVPKTFDREAEKEALWFCGVDFSSSKDLTAVTLSTEFEDKTILKCFGFLPRAAAEGKLDRNTKRARFLFEDPEKNGVFLSRRDIIDPKEVVDFLQDPDKGLGHLNIFSQIACDRARVFSFENLDSRFEFLPISQSPMAITGPTCEFERLALDKKIYCNSLLLKYCVENSRMSPPENAAVRAIFKTRSEDSVDAAISSILSVFMLRKFGPEAATRPRVFNVNMN